MTLDGRVEKPLAVSHNRTGCDSQMCVNMTFQFPLKVFSLCVKRKSQQKLTTFRIHFSVKVWRRVMLSRSPHIKTPFFIIADFYLYFIMYAAQNNTSSNFHCRHPAPRFVAPHATVGGKITRL